MYVVSRHHVCCNLLECYLVQTLLAAQQANELGNEAMRQGIMTLFGKPVEWKDDRKQEWQCWFSWCSRRGIIHKASLSGGARERSRKSAFCVKIMLHNWMEWEGCVWMQYCCQGEKGTLYTQFGEWQDSRRLLRLVYWLYEYFRHRTR